MIYKFLILFIFTTSISFANTENNLELDLEQSIFIETALQKDESLKPKSIMCIYKNAKILYPPINRAPKVDKYQHCTLSCQLTLRCDPKAVYSLGLMKEFLDLLGYGTPSKADLAANMKGILFGLQTKISTNKHCSEVCDKEFPTP